MEASIDGTLFSDWAKQARGFPFKNRPWLENLGRLAREHAAERLKSEIEYWKKAGIADFPYPLLKRISELRKQDENGFPLQLGFGTGWEGMTIGAPLKDDPRWPEIHRRYELGKAPKAKTQTPPEEFPASRRVAVGKDGRPRLPLGWVWIGWEVV